MASTGVQVVGERVSPVYAAPVPDFQALPSSISEAQFVQPTKVEFYPSDDFPEVDLKGHSVEELAVAAGVSIEVIKSAIKLRQQQLMLEKKMKANSVKTKQWKTTPQFTASPKTTEVATTQSTTTTKPSTTAYVPKKKVSKKPTKNGHKVRNLTRLLQ